MSKPLCPTISKTNYPSLKQSLHEYLQRESPDMRAFYMTGFVGSMVATDKCMAKVADNAAGAERVFFTHPAEDVDDGKGNANSVKPRVYTSATHPVNLFSEVTKGMFVAKGQSEHVQKQSLKWIESAQSVAAGLVGPMDPGLKLVMNQRPLWEVSWMGGDLPQMRKELEAQLGSSAGVSIDGAERVLQKAKIRRDLVSVKQGDTETVQELFTRVQLLLDDLTNAGSPVTDESDKELVGIIFLALNARFADDLVHAKRTGALKDVDTFEAAKQLIIEWEITRDTLGSVLSSSNTVSVAAAAVTPKAPSAATPLNAKQRKKAAKVAARAQQKQGVSPLSNNNGSGATPGSSSHSHGKFCFMCPSSGDHDPSACPKLSAEVKEQWLASRSQFQTWKGGRKQPN